MKLIDTLSSIFLILVGGGFCLSSLKLGLGRMSAPGPGLIPFATGGLIIILSLGVIVETHLRSKDEVEVKLFRGKRMGVIISVFLSLFLYILLLNLIGFYISTFLLLLFLFKISEKQSWGFAIGASLLTTIFTFLLFDYLLNLSFPKGLLGI